MQRNLARQGANRVRGSSGGEEHFQHLPRLESIRTWGRAGQPDFPDNEISMRRDRADEIIANQLQVP